MREGSLRIASVSSSDFKILDTEHDRGRTAVFRDDDTTVVSFQPFDYL